jgi:hypothetical protein
MATAWTISVGGRNYGPFSIEQMQTFVSEGRLVRESLVVRDDSTTFRNAGDEPELRWLFPPQLAAAPPPEPARHSDAPASPGFGRSEERPSKGERGHFVIIADMKSRSIAKLEEQIFALGPAYSVLPQVWLLSSDQSLNAIRNLLIQQLGKIDLLFVVDATNDKTAWFNFGPEADARIRKIWAKERPQRFQATG